MCVYVWVPVCVCGETFSDISHIVNILPEVSAFYLKWLFKKSLQNNSYQHMLSFDKGVWFFCMCVFVHVSVQKILNICVNVFLYV